LCALVCVRLFVVARCSGAPRRRPKLHPEIAKSIPAGSLARTCRRRAVRPNAAAATMASRLGADGDRGGFIAVDSTTLPVFTVNNCVFPGGELNHHAPRW
jgi:hypothetical protein